MWKELRLSCSNPDFILQCRELIRALFAPAGWDLRWAGEDTLNIPFFGQKQQTWESLPAWVARKEGQAILFCPPVFSQAILKEIAMLIGQQDKDAYQWLAVLLCENNREMDQWRSPDYVENWPRGFFSSLEELQKQLQRIDPGTFQNMVTVCLPESETGQSLPSMDVRTFEAEVMANLRVGGEDSRHYKMRFRAPGIKQVSAGQFIMMDTRPADRVPALQSVPLEKLAGEFDVTPHAFLKRPFGIHRTFYPGFEADSFARLVLPPRLAPALYLPFPIQFDIFYKVLENGVGTREMLQLKRGDRLQMVGPLGKRYDPAELSRNGIEEIHLIGGGVGMAPLISTAQILRILGFQVKAFIGMESWESLRYFDDIERSFGEEFRAAYIYVDELRAAGVRREDLFVSCDREGEVPLDLPIPTENFLHGFSSTLYRRFLERSPSSLDLASQGKSLAFTCGPMPMMKAVREICHSRRIPLKVLMEKRMACGVGVCLSCVCKTINDEGAEQYSRVCTDGPIFDADKLKWD